MFISAFVTVILILWGISAISRSSPLSTSSPSTSKECRECHEEIYNHWKNAMHSMSIEDPIFKASYMDSYLRTAGKTKFHCLRCHAPLTLVNNDYDLTQKITKEGVNCDFCHSIKEVNVEERENPFQLDIGDVKRGPLSKAISKAHKTEPSPLFKSSQLCAGCHEFVNEHGVTVLGTYSEWKSSPYSEEKVHCQNCHMPLIPGQIVKTKIKPSPEKEINLHAISASHSEEQLRKALKVEIKNIYQEKDFISVTVAVTNTGSGHAVPTGIPSRKLILRVELKTPGEYFSHQRTYQKLIADSSGRVLHNITDIFLEGAQISSDNRIRPHQTKIESFTFARPKNKKITIRARVEYLYKAKILRPTEMRVKMAEDIKHFSQ